MAKIRVAIVGVGNCASSLLQGIEFYQHAPAQAQRSPIGLMHYDLAGYKPGDIEVACAFDIDSRKVGRPLEDACFAMPNNTITVWRDLPKYGVTVDMGEIRDHRWLQPADAIARRDAEEIELAPPTWVTLHRLARAPNVAAAIADARATEPEFFETHIARVEGGAAALWEGDAGYESNDADAPGPRHRLWMLPAGWRYERTEE